MNRLDDMSDTIVWLNGLNVMGLLLTEADGKGLVSYEHDGVQSKAWFEKDDYFLYETVNFQHYEDNDGTLEL